MILLIILQNLNAKEFNPDFDNIKKHQGQIKNMDVKNTFKSNHEFIESIKNNTHVSEIMEHRNISEENIDQINECGTNLTCQQYNNEQLINQLVQDNVQREEFVLGDDLLEGHLGAETFYDEETNQWCQITNSEKDSEYEEKKCSKEYIFKDHQCFKIIDKGSIKIESKEDITGYNGWQCKIDILEAKQPCLKLLSTYEDKSIIEKIRDSIDNEDCPLECREHNFNTDGNKQYSIKEYKYNFECDLPFYKSQNIHDIDYKNQKELGSLYTSYDKLKESCRLKGSNCLETMDNIGHDKICSKQEDIYECKEDLVNNCGIYSNNGCSQSKSECIEFDEDNRCIKREFTFKCKNKHGNKSQQKICFDNKNDLIHPSINSEQAEQANSQAFLQAASHLDLVDNANRQNSYNKSGSIKTIFDGKLLRAFKPCGGKSSQQNIDCSEDSKQRFMQTKLGQCYVYDFKRGKGEEVYRHSCCFPSKFTRVISEYGKCQLMGLDKAQCDSTEKKLELFGDECAGINIEDFKKINMQNIPISEIYSGSDYDNSKFEKSLNNYINRLIN